MLAPALKQRGEKNDRAEGEGWGGRWGGQEKKKAHLSQSWCGSKEFRSFEKLRNTTKF